GRGFSWAFTVEEGQPRSRRGRRSTATLHGERHASAESVSAQAIATGPPRGRGAGRRPGRSATTSQWHSHGWPDGSVSQAIIDHAAAVAEWARYLDCRR